MNYMVHQAWTSCATLARLFFSQNQGAPESYTEREQQE
jgi:hypothetical protein